MFILRFYSESESDEEEEEEKKENATDVCNIPGCNCGNLHLKAKKK